MPQRHVLRAPAPVRGVLFDLHSTLVDQGSAEEWLDRALASEPTHLDAVAREQAVAWLDRIWEGARVADPDSLRDRSPEHHERVFHELLAAGPGLPRELGDALYSVLLDTWHAYEDTVPTLVALRAAGIRVCVISNVGVDVGHVLEREGIAPLVDAVVLSKDVGAVKPDLPIFTAALAAIGCTPQDGLMVGDSGRDDAGGTVVGLRTIVLPRTRGPVHGLSAVVDFVRATRSLDLLPAT